MFEIGEAIIRASDLSNCIYCSNILPSCNKEHIFNGCWGGRHKTSHLVCDTCNAAFSESEVDSALTIHTAFVMNAWGFKGKRHDIIPVIETDGDYRLGKWATPILKNPIIEYKPKDDKLLRIGIKANSKSEIRKMLLDKGKFQELLGHDLTVNEAEALKNKIKGLSVISEEVGLLSTKVNINIQNEYRSAAHTILKCIGLYSPELVKDQTTASVREFARYGKGHWKDFALVLKQELSLDEVVRNSCGVYFNSTEIYWSRLNGKIIGVLTLLGRVKRSVVISENYQGPDAILTVIEPIYGSSKLKSSVFKVAPVCPPIPHCSIAERPPDDHSLLKEFAIMCQTSVSTDSMLASLMNRLSKMADISPIVSQAILREMEIIFSDSVVSFARMLGVVINNEQAISMLIENGFNKLAGCIGMNCRDDEIQLIMGSALLVTLKKIQSVADKPPGRSV